MNTAVIESKEGTEEEQEMIHHTNCKGYRLIMDHEIFGINITYFMNDCNNVGHLLWLVAVLLEKLPENKLPCGYSCIKVLEIYAIWCVVDRSC